MRTHSDACRWPGATLIPYLLCLICLNPEPRDRYSDHAAESTGDQGGDNLIFRYICPNTRCGEQQASAQYYARATRLSWPPRKTVDCATMQQNSNSFARPHHITHNCPSTRCGELAFGASKTTRWCEHGSKYRARGDVMETMIILFRSNPQLMCLCNTTCVFPSSYDPRALGKRDVFKLEVSFHRDMGRKAKRTPAVSHDNYQWGGPTIGLKTILQATATTRAS